MKDNTAAVHVQVPVEVTSFLLNEKRTEITKIELKQRVTVLLVPNKTLETPNYRLERLRHDDPRLENLQASYTMIDEPEEEVGFTRREKGKAKQEPVIKGILPETPAPQPAPKVAARAGRRRAGAGGRAGPERAGRWRLLRLGQGAVRRRRGRTGDRHRPPARRSWRRRPHRRSKDVPSGAIAADVAVAIATGAAWRGRAR